MNYISQLRKKFKNVDADKCNNKINKIKVYEKGTDNLIYVEDIVRPATSYERSRITSYFR